MADQHDAAPGGVSASGDNGPGTPGAHPSERVDIPRPDFDALRKARNARTSEWIAKFAAEHGVPASEVRTTFNPHACYCACAAGGPCEHLWDGEGVEFDDGCGWSATCSRCGTTSMGHSMRVGM